MTYDYVWLYASIAEDALMIRFRLDEILKQKEWTPYRLSQETGLTVPTAYRLADPEQRFGRFRTDTLDRLCRALDVQPGDLLEWVPGEQDERRRVAGRREVSG